MRFKKRGAQQELDNIAKTTQKTYQSRIEAGDLGLEMYTYERVFQLLKG